MIYRDFKGMKLSGLGFGTMRLPETKDKRIDQKQVEEMTAYAMEHGINYFDTALPYHSGKSEVSIGKALSTYPRESYYLADKYPGHETRSNYDPAEVFEDQLKKCGVDYFDFYLLHNVNEGCIDTYLDPHWGIVDYFKEQRRLGRIKHLGFSCHGGVAMMRDFLDAVGEDMEFCQIQLNWLDWSLQDARGKVELLNERSVPIWVMEPLRGGRLCKLSEDDEARLKALRPDEGLPAWGFRFLQSIPGVTMVLSGMSNMEQMMDNVDTWAEDKPVDEREKQTLLEIAEGLKEAVPCTACRYCVKECPMGLDIPGLISIYNDLKMAFAYTVTMRIEFLPEDKKPAACLACGRCQRMCPQGIKIPEVMAALDEKLKSMPSWKEISRKREEAAMKAKGR